jgi:hypothetical protein
LETGPQEAEALETGPLEAGFLRDQTLPRQALLKPGQPQKKAAPQSNLGWPWNLSCRLSSDLLRSKKAAPQPDQESLRKALLNHRIRLPRQGKRMRRKRLPKMLSLA